MCTLCFVEDSKYIIVYTQCQRLRVSDWESFSILQIVSHFTVLVTCRLVSCLKLLSELLSLCLKLPSQHRLGLHISECLVLLIQLPTVAQLGYVTHLLLLRPAHHFCFLPSHRILPKTQTLQQHFVCSGASMVIYSFGLLIYPYSRC